MSIPDFGQATYNTGITRAPAITPQQMQQSLGIFKGLGNANPSQPYAPAMQGATPQQMGSVGDSLRALQGQAGARAANGFQNQVGQDNANLAFNQANADSGLGRAYQGFLGSRYTNALDRQNTLNMAQIQNALRQQRLGIDLFGSLFGGMMNGVGGLMGSAGGGLGSGGGMGDPTAFMNNIPGIDPSAMAAANSPFSSLSGIPGLGGMV